MRIMTADHIRHCDRYTQDHEPISAADLMERAGTRLAQALQSLLPRMRSACVLCGPGNNGGDGAVLARALYGHGLDVQLWLLPGTPTAETAYHLQRARQAGVPCTDLTDAAAWPAPAPGVVVVDALYGIGISRPLAGLAAALVTRLHELPNPVVALDLPSGLSPDCAFASTERNTVRALYTLTVHGPKLAFFMPENAPYVGQFRCVDIGWLPGGEDAQAPHWLTLPTVADTVRPRPRFGHKGTFGHCLLVAGSTGTVGAALLASSAALRTGCGLVSVMLPAHATATLNAYLPEAMTVADLPADGYDTAGYSAVGLGPGMGTDEAASARLWHALRSAPRPMVLDADALGMLAQHPHWYSRLGPHVILTPHPKEFDRLTRPHATGAERYRSQIEFARRHQVTVVLKGHYSSIVTHAGQVYINSTGSSGMATAGSGDVLTGILTSLLAQGYAPEQAAQVGVYLHGYAGDLAAAQHSQTAMIASDIVAHIGGFWQRCERV